MAARLLHFEVGRSVHPIYREQLHALPPGWSVASPHPGLLDPSVGTRLIQGQDTRLRAPRELAERIALRVLGRAGHVRLAGVPPEPGAELIHSAELLLRDPGLPYVVDFEHVNCFVLYQQIALSRPWARRRLRAAVEDERCRYLLPWCDAARNRFLAALGPESAARVAPKTVTVLPAIRPVADRPARRASGPLRVLFIGTKFFEKGGVEAVGAVERLSGSHDVRMEMISYVPPEWQARIDASAVVTAHRPGPRSLVDRLYAESDVLLFPSHMDTFGYVVLEANAYGLPAVAADHHAMPEIVADGESGLLFPSENPLYGDDGRCSFDQVLPPPRSYMAALEQPSDAHVDRIASRLAELAEDDDLHARLAAAAFERVRSGAFSIGRRRDLLERLYEDAATETHRAAPSRLSKRRRTSR
jgi:glycosyltransferase involved in cell wall biosynthesis